MCIEQAILNLLCCDDHFHDQPVVLGDGRVASIDIQEMAREIVLLRRIVQTKFRHETQEEIIDCEYTVIQTESRYLLGGSK